MRWARAHIGRQIEEIAADPALRAYGVALVAIHLLTAFWLRHNDLASIVGAGKEAICWPLLPECERLRVLSAPALNTAFKLYGAIAVLVMVGFWRRRWIAGGYWGLVLLTVFKLAVIALDFRLRRNQHYMAFATTALFLFVPRKRDGIRVLLVLFYFWAGTLKLNWEWISGGGLYRPLWFFTGRGIIAACLYVVVLELVIVWGLLARWNWIFWPCFAQVVVFHIMSWSVVGFFYPLLMFGLLSIFVFCRLGRDGAAERLGATLAQGHAPRPVYVVAIAFSALQLTVHLYPGDTALTGEGRLFALHMFDARVECDARATVKLPRGDSFLVSLRGAGERTACDPITIYGAARNLCRQREAGRMSFVDLDVDLISRRTTDVVAKPIIALRDFCRSRPRYDPFMHNYWLGAGP